MSKSLSLLFTRSLLCASAGLATICLPPLLSSNTAWAQDEPEPEPEPVPGNETDVVGLEEDLEEDLGFDDVDPDGGEENPDDPNSTFSATKVEAKANKPTGYPARVINRPLNLPGGMVELGLDIPIHVDPFGVSSTLRGAYGITRSVSVGLQYSPGRYSDEFSVGKAVGVDAQYLITDIIAAQLTIPVYLDPFAMGIVLGAPFKYTMFDKFSIVGGRNLMGFKVHEFLPSVENSTANDGLLDARNSDTIVPVWVVNATAGAIYQLDDKIALDALFGTRFDDTNDAATSSLDLGILYAQSNKLDFGARLGVADLASFTESLGLRLFLNFRI